MKRVTDFLATYNIPAKDVSVNKLGDMITVSMPVKTANNMLKTEFALFRSVMQRDVAIPRVTKPYYLPSEIAEVVSLVAEIVRFPSLRNGPNIFGAEESDGTDPEFNSCGTKCNGYTTVSLKKEFIDVFAFSDCFSCCFCCLFSFFSPMC